MATPEEIQESFWKKVNKTNRCWLWTASQKPNGYGQFNVNKRAVRAHRYSYELNVGPIGLDDKGKSLLVLHRCDVKLCVRPDHLWLGTQRDNVIDMMRKGRHGNAKLSASDIVTIKRLYGILTYKQIATIYGVKNSTISSVLWGESYRWPFYDNLVQQSDESQINQYINQVTNTLADDEEVTMSDTKTGYRIKCGDVSFNVTTEQAEELRSHFDATKIKINKPQDPDWGPLGGMIEDMLNEYRRPSPVGL